MDSYLGSLTEPDRAEYIAAAHDLHDAMNETGTQDFRACSRDGRPPADDNVPDGIRSLQQLRALARTIRTSSQPDPTEIPTATNAGAPAATPHTDPGNNDTDPDPAGAAEAMNRTGGEATATALVIAGRSIDIDTAIATAHGYPAVTVTRYDLPGPGPTDVITADEIARTHQVRSRISHVQRDWFIRSAVDAPWEAVPIEAQLVDADPNISGELYDRAETLYDHFRTTAPRHVGVAKLSKVLHLKRPGLFPILDSKVMAFYRLHARAAAARYPHRGRRAMFWAAIRDDVCTNLDSGALPLFRRRLEQSEAEQVRRIATLTDVRLLDLLTWAVA